MEFSLLEDEKFDFDLPLSPEEERPDLEDEDEIFFGPIGHNERCVATNTDIEATKISDEIEVSKPLSPLNPEQIVEIFKEATSMALMFKSSCSEDEPSKLDNPELINDVTEKICPNNTQKENLLETNELSKPLQDSSSIEQLPTDDSFVVRKRVLKDRNNRNFDNKGSPKQLATKTQSIARKTPGQNRAQISKLHKLKTHPKPPHMQSPLKVNKSLVYGIVEDSPKLAVQNSSNVRKSRITPRKTSTSSKAERSFSSTKSLSTSDLSFTDETKQTKLPMPSQSGLKPPGFGGCPRQRTSSNSSVSSTSSTSSLTAHNPNETFLVARPSGASSTSKPKLQKSLPCPKDMLTKISTLKPVFAKPNEVSKTSKLQPMKALQRPMGPIRSKSNIGYSSSPSKMAARTTSAGSTPLRSQTPRADKTKGLTPLRRRSTNISLNTSVGMVTRKRQSGTVVSSENTKKPVTPLKSRRSAPAIPSSAEKAKPEVVSSGLTVRRPGGMMRRSWEGQRDTLGKPCIVKNTKRATTPENRPSMEHDSVTCTTPNSDKTTGGKQILQSGSCKKRHSLLPTPKNRKRENTSGSSPAACPVPFSLSPSVVTPKDVTNIKPFGMKKLDLSEVPTILVDNNYAASGPFSPDSLHDNSDNSEAYVSEIKYSSPEERIPDRIKTWEVPDLMAQDSPMVMVPFADHIIDPFSPGIESPDLPIEGCLNPVVLHMEDLIDLSHMSPKPEVDLIDLTAKSPMVEAQLVDF